MVLKSEAGAEWSMLAEAMSVGWISAGSLTDLLYDAGTGSAFVCSLVRACTSAWGSRGQYQCYSQLISGYLQDVATLICYHRRHICGFGVTRGLLFPHSCSLLIEILCPETTEWSFHCMCICLITV